MKTRLRRLLSFVAIPLLVDVLGVIVAILFVFVVVLLFFAIVLLLVPLISFCLLLLESVLFADPQQLLAPVFEAEAAAALRNWNPL